MSDDSPSSEVPARRRWPWVVGAVAAAAAVAVVALLVWDTPGARLARAVDATVAEGSAEVRVVGTVADLPLLGDVELSVAEGVVDFEEGATSLRRELPFLDQVPVPGVEDIGTVELVFAEGGTWLRSVALERSWVRLAGEHPDDRVEGTDPAATAPGLGNPLAVLALLRAIEGEPEEAGEERVDGVDTTRFRVEVDLDAVADELDEDGALLSSLERLHPDGRAPLEVWLDDDDRVRRVAYEGSVDLVGVELGLGTVVELDGFGVDADVRAPEAEEIVDLSALTELDPLGRLRELLEALPGV